MIAPNRETVRGKSARKSHPLKIAAYLLVPITLVALCVWFFSDSNSQQNAQPRQKKAARKQIHAVKPVQKQIPSQKEVVQTNSLSVAWQKYYDGRDTNKWMVVYNPITKQEYLSRVVETGLKNAPPPLYKAHSLNLLDAIAFKPIVSPMANVRIDERFMRDLQEGLLEKITFEPNDSEEAIARKEAMIELQKELIARLKSGEDIQQLISDSLAERNRVANLKQAMRVERANMKRNGIPQEEIDEFVDACNKKLSELGATPLVSKAMLFEQSQQSEQ